MRNVITRLIKKQCRICGRDYAWDWPEERCICAAHGFLYQILAYEECSVREPKRTSGRKGRG